MAKQRLNKSIRADLYAFAEASIASPETEKVMLEAYKKALDAVNAVIESRYPASEMDVLRKHNTGGCPSYILVCDPEGNAASFDAMANMNGEPELDIARHDSMCVKFSKGRHVAYPYLYGGMPWMPRDAHSKGLPVSDEIFELVAASVRAKNAHAEALNKKLDMYRQLIAGARYCEDVVEAWPAAAKMMPDGPSGGALTISAEAIAAIKADNAGA